MANLRAHNTDNYEVAKKIQIYARTAGSTGPWESFGSVKEVVCRKEETTLEHFSNYLGARVKDREEVTERRMQIDFIFEEFNSANLKHALGAGFEASTSGTKDVLYEQTKTNPGAGGTIATGKADIKNVFVRSTGLEADLTYDELAFAASGEVCEANDFNNVTSPLTVVGAVTTYALITFAVGKLFRFGTEVLRVTAIAGNDVTFARAQLGTVAAIHANGVAIEEGAGDYSVNLTTGVVTILWTGDLDDESTVPKVHISFAQERDVEEFELFPGRLIECEIQLQYGTTGQVEKIWGPIENAILKNNGDIALGDGSDWSGIPMRVEGFGAADGTFGTIGLVKEVQS